MKKIKWMLIDLKLNLLTVLTVTISAVANGQSAPNKKPLSVTSTDGVSIAYETLGNGSTAIVFVHGWSCDKSYWKAQTEHFAKNYKVVAVDLGGHGESGVGRKDWTIYSFGTDVAEVIKHLKLERVILVGHSMGGDVIADVALQLPGRVLGLIMVDTYKKLGMGRPQEQIDAFVADFSVDFSTKVQKLVRSMYLPNSDPKLVEYVARDMSSAPPDVALSAMRSSFTHSRQITHDLEILKLPVIAINPDDQPSDVESMNKHGVELMILPGVSHFLMMEDPKRFNTLLDYAVQKLTNQ
jgi:pimeloyl-ACP methyl ester carboxylesterase